MTIGQSGDGSEPLVLTTKDPVVLIGQLTQFPPRGDLYQLQKPVEPVEPVDPEDPAKALAVIEKFPVEVGGLRGRRFAIRLVRGRPAARAVISTSTRWQFRPLLPQRGRAPLLVTGPSLRPKRSRCCPYRPTSAP
ncbi:hypothetical protein [Streptomyces sp. NPDC002215]|uniref:hypothetical protein n=1 Tax=Streptomyces sp. NPDC002215 TaxID=3154412 RepID=UPI00332BE898